MRKNAAEDKTGKVYGALTVVKHHSYVPNQRQNKWECHCKCGEVKIMWHCALIDGEYLGCKNCKEEKRFLDRDNKYKNTKVNKITMLRYLYFQRRNRRHFWECQCDCGQILEMAEDKVFSKTVPPSCLRCHLDDKCEDLTGNQYGFFTVIKFHGNKIISGKERRFWECQCRCGNVKILPSSPLKKRDETYNCGCRRDLSHGVGPTHPKWNPNRDPKERRRSRDSRFREWSKQVLGRDRFVCHLTGLKIRRLVAHHLYAWNAYPDLRYNLKNGITIGRDWHLLFHKLYGRGGNTPEQFQEFKERYLSGEFN